MRLKRFKYEKSSPLKYCYVKLSSTWNEVKATIASDFDLDVTSDTIESSSIVVADSELHEEESIPTLESYLHHRKGGIGRTTFGLYISSALSEEVLNLTPLSHLNIANL